MTYFLKFWTNPNDNSQRLYIQGTTRASLYLKLSEGKTLVWSSKANDTPPKFRTGDHWGKVRKDGDAASEACEAFGLELGGGTDEWERALQTAASGVGYETPDEVETAR